VIYKGIKQKLYGPQQYNISQARPHALPDVWPTVRKQFS